MLKNKADYSLYKCPYEHIEKACGHELEGPENYEGVYGVWCACGFRGPAFCLEPKDLKLELKSSSFLKLQEENEKLKEKILQYEGAVVKTSDTELKFYENPSSKKFITDISKKIELNFGYDTVVQETYNPELHRLTISIDEKFKDIQSIISFISFERTPCEKNTLIHKDKKYTDFHYDPGENKCQ